MRTGAAATLLVWGLLALTACGPSQPPVAGATIQGNVFASPSAGGAPVQGARVTVRVGDDTQSVSSDIGGHFSFELNTPQTAQALTVTVEPPAESNLYAATYDSVTLEAYRSPYGAAGELNIYLGTTKPSAFLPGAAPRLGCLTGVLKDVDGTPLASNALEVVPTAQGTFVPRPLYDDPTCAATITSIPNFLAGYVSLPQPGETGLVLYVGYVVVRTDAQGRYRLPLQSPQNLFAASGSMWAGNYDGTDTGNLKTANAFFWSKFQYLPEVPVFLSGATATQNLLLESFDPATNPRVTTQTVQYDGSAVNRVGGAFEVETVPSFEHALTSSALMLGQYYKDNPSGSDTLRVMRLGQGTRAQHISVVSTLTRYDPADSTFLGDSRFTGWRDGTNLGQPLGVNFLGIPDPQAPALDETGTSRTPTLTWSGVGGARLYQVVLFRSLEDGPEPVWEGYTPGTSLTLPFALEANADYSWQIYANDSYDVTYVLGSDPVAMEASRWVSAGKLPRARGDGSALNTWRGQAARAIWQATGAPPQRFLGPADTYQNLLETGSREANSQEFTFTTGN